MSEFRLRIAGPDGELVADFQPSSEWYADGWNAERVATVLRAHAEQWRFDQIVHGGVDSLDEERLRNIEATAAFFELLARIDCGEYGSLEELHAELAASFTTLDRHFHGVIAEEAFGAG